MFCKNCGTKSDGTKKFCTNCGKQFFNASKAEPSQVQGAPNFTKPKSESSWSAGRIIGIIVIVALIGWGAYSSSDDDSIEKNNNALTAYDSGNSEQAITQFQEASRLAITDDTKINTLKNLGYVLTSEGRVDEAVASFEEALALTSGDSYDYYLISGEIADLQNKPNSTLLSFNKAYAKGPDEFQVNNSLALFYMDIEDLHPQYVDYKKALTYAQKAYNLSSQEIAKSNLAIAHYFNGNYTQTILLLSTSDVSKAPLKAYFLGLSYAQVDDAVNAKKYLKMAIAAGLEVPQEVPEYINTH
jgi:tetratricopeptide (TPR) repeat protein